MLVRTVARFLPASHPRKGTTTQLFPVPSRTTDCSHGIELSIVSSVVNFTANNFGNENRDQFGTLAITMGLYCFFTGCMGQAEHGCRQGFWENYCGGFYLGVGSGTEAAPGRQKFANRMGMTKEKRNMPFLHNPSGRSLSRTTHGNWLAGLWQKRWAGTAGFIARSYGLRPTVSQRLSDFCNAGSLERDISWAGGDGLTEQGKKTKS